MANTREIRRRIKSIKNTAQITKAMQMVAASKMRRAQVAALAGRPMAEILNKVLVSVNEHVEVDSHPLLVVRPVKKELVILIATDKGLCGALNTNLFRELSQFDLGTTSFICSGRKGAQYVTRTKRDMLSDFQIGDHPQFRDTRPIANLAMEKFLSGEFDKVSVAYTHFINTLTQKPTIETLLPISPFALARGFRTAHQGAEAAPAAKSVTRAPGFIFEPDPESVLDYVLPQYVRFEVFQMLVDTRASEHSARMVAMKSATDNAKQIVKDLTLEYNKVRQAGITTELLEITTAQLALN
jgi:F-type H+-transporting ATPase subunit gamma